MPHKSDPPTSDTAARVPNRRVTPNGPVTADDVAEIAGVSRWTVTRAFKMNASVSEKTRAKVMKAAEQLGYVPDLLASSLASERSNLVAVLVDDFNNPHKLVMLERLTAVMRRAGIDTLLVNTLGTEDAPTALLNASQRRVDAAVLIGVNFDDTILHTALGARRVKKLILFARASGNADTISICVDDVVAMRSITDYVISRGYRRPLFLAGPNTGSAHVFRKETFVALWQERFGTAPEVADVGSYDPTRAYQVVTETLRSRPRPTLPDVIVAENDAMAIGAMDAVRHELGLSVPGDIAITGFDDVPLAGTPIYDLTTYRQPMTEMAEALVQVVQNQRGDLALQAFTGQLIPRSSA